MRFQIKIILIFLLVLLGNVSSYSQIINDTIFIKFKNKTDIIKEIDGEITEIWLWNELYKKELNTYEETMERIKSYGDSILLTPPITPPAIKPNKFYKYFLVDCVEYYPINMLKEIENYYDRKKLKSLDPYKKRINIVRTKKDTLIFYPVSFYKNVIE